MKTLTNGKYKATIRDNSYSNDTPSYSVLITYDGQVCGSMKYYTTLNRAVRNARQQLDKK